MDTYNGVEYLVVFSTEGAAYTGWTVEIPSLRKTLRSDTAVRFESKDAAQKEAEEAAKRAIDAGR